MGSRKKGLKRKKKESGRYKRREGERERERVNVFKKEVKTKQRYGEKTSGVKKKMNVREIKEEAMSN